MPESLVLSQVSLPAGLAPELDAAFRQALTLCERANQTWAPDDRTAVADASKHAMQLLGLPHFEPSPGTDSRIIGYTARPIMRAEDLTATQRAVLTAVVDQSTLFGGTYPIPATAWARRQWLGLVAPGPLWVPTEDGEPRFFALRRILAAGVAEFSSHLNALPIGERVPLLFEMDFLLADIQGPVAELMRDAVPAIDGTLGPWAREAAERLLAGTTRAETNGRDIGRCHLVFAALVAGHVPIEPSYDALLRIHQPKVPSQLDAWLVAIPEARRENAVMAAMTRLTFDHDRVMKAIELLPRWPFVPLAIYAAANVASCRFPKQVRDVLKEVSAAQPHLKKALADWKKSQPKPLNIKRTSLARLATLLPLNPTQAAQLELAAKDYSGVACSAAAIVAGQSDPDEPILPKTIKLIRFEGPRGVPAIELWELMGDSGTFFRAGTTEIVAYIGQSGVESDDKVLAAALQLALAGP